MALDTARIAVSMGIDPMAVLDWPQDVRTAVVRVLNGTDQHIWADDMETPEDLFAAFAGVKAALEDG